MSLLFDEINEQGIAMLSRKYTASSFFSLPMGMTSATLSRSSTEPDKLFQTPSPLRPRSVRVYL